MAERTGVVSSGEEETQGYLTDFYDYMRRGFSEVGVSLFFYVSSERKKGNGLKLCQD